MQMAEKGFNELTLCWLAYKLQDQDQGEKEKRSMKTRKK